MKSEIIILAASLALSSQAAVPLRWTVETSRLQPVVFDAVRGETLALEATFQSYGKQLQTTNLTAFLCWQTNGMENAWWMTNAVTTATVARVLFTPEMDPGATTVNAFIGLSDTANQPTNLTTQQPSLSYRAACTIRFRHGPGAVPNVIEQPPRVLDLAHTVVINAPWPTQEDFAATTTVMRAELKDYVDEQIESAGIVTPQSVTNISSSVTSNIVTKSYVEGLGISGGGVDTNAVKSLIDNEIGGTNAVKAAVADVATIKADYTTHAESTNAANAAITNAVTSGYLCTVANAQTMTNTRLPASDSMSVYGHYAITNSLDISGVIYIMMEIDTHLYCRTWDCFYNVDSQESLPDYLSSLAWHPSNVSLADYGITNAIPTKTSQLTNDSGFITSQTATNISASVATNIVKDATNNLQKVAHSGSYNDLEDKPTAQSLGAYPNSSGVSLQSQVSAIGAHLNAEDAHFVSTNYDSSANIPEAYAEIKINNSWIKIWNEMTRWTKFVGNSFNWNAWVGFHTWMTNVTSHLSFKADRCWGVYDSETGGYSPEGYTQISSSNILIAANMAYQRTVTSGGSVWILQCNTGSAHIGGDTNGFFRIMDGDGVTQFEIINGDKQELGADADGITVDNSTTPSTVTIPYSVEASDHPVLQICDNLSGAQWHPETDDQCIANVSWSGSSGAYVATVQSKTAVDKLFVRATYMSGGETYIHNVAPVGMDSIILNGTKYYLGTAVIGGHTVLTLSTTPQNQ